MIRAPDPPSGWPSAIAPPLGLRFFSSAPTLLMDRPDRFSAFAVAGIGAVSMITGLAPARTAVWILAIGLSLNDFAFSSDIISTAAAPSEICDELPAWITPSSLNAGFS